MWEQFTEQSRRVVFYAQQEAAQLGRSDVSTEHLLLALIRDDNSVATGILKRLGISSHRIRSEVELIVGQGNSPWGREAQLTPRAKEVIELAREEAQQLSSEYIETQHLLIGLIREEKGIAGLVLRKLNLELETVRLEVVRLQNTTPEDSQEKRSEISTRLSVSEKELIARKIQALAAEGQMTNGTMVMLKGLTEIVIKHEGKDTIMPIFAGDLLLLLEHIPIAGTTTDTKEQPEESSSDESNS